MPPVRKLKNTNATNGATNRTSSPIAAGDVSANGPMLSLPSSFTASRQARDRRCDPNGFGASAGQVRPVASGGEFLEPRQPLALGDELLRFRGQIQGPLIPRDELAQRVIRIDRPQGLVLERNRFLNRDASADIQCQRRVHLRFEQFVE